ncbi:hypothetical protein M427DRAFT_277796 [Gonapodya prolifera JEL478]|uniref:HMG box domain-containing protein n=1 Tax=Gonapodya prolifera (strain JEL478) TaxID=1344416 RepID=A0A139AYC9_GONPJ|nr:hypothetical protein M427DRAFT_277796 [Gonapodya prolifera JEL478]|eukprot:KXS21752.1 hypothetical protein M427DRAFT_277796 [Gonapodya prolifera JEL478]
MFFQRAEVDLAALVASSPCRPDFVLLQLPAGKNQLREFMFGREGGKRRHRRRRVDTKPPRCPNAFLLYRRSLRLETRRYGIDSLPFAEQSKLLAAWWQSENEEIRKHYQKMYTQAQMEHREIFSLGDPAPVQANPDETPSKDRSGYYDLLSPTSQMAQEGSPLDDGMDLPIPFLF